MLIAGTVGPVVLSDGVAPAAGVRLDRTGGLMATELQGRFYENTFRNAKFASGMALTSISAATFTTSTLGATCTPIIGLWNPYAATNLVVLGAVLSITLTALTATGAGPFVWAVSTGNTAITTGAIPWSRKTLTQVGSSAKGMGGVALTGLTNNLVVAFASALGGGQPYNVSEVATAAGFMPQQEPYYESFDGGLIVPPGGVLALLATTTPVAHSAVSAIVWDEVAA